MTNYVFVTGGVLSSLGKGIVTASTALLFKSMGYSVTAIKIDPYVNVDASTMNPFAHGEVFVTEDGGETDLDLGHYERFLNQNLSKNNNVTTGKIYLSVIEKERRGEYLGQTVQIIPHVTNEIKNRIREVSRDYDIAVIEIGGTVGDIESLPFLEAAREMWIENYGKVAFVHVALVPVLKTTGEQKTKPLQHSVQELRRIGIQPHVIIARSEKPLEPEAANKIALYSNVPREAVFSDHDVGLIYEVPLILKEQGYDKYLTKILELPYKNPDLSKWEEFVSKLRNAEEGPPIAMIGKYVKLKDSYISIIEALNHASAYIGIRPKLVWVDSEKVEKGKLNASEIAEEVVGGIVLPGFGARGAEGKIAMIKELRERGKGVLGICFGMQMMAVEVARNLAGLEGAHSEEIDPDAPHLVVKLLEDQRYLKYLGGTLRLGARKVKLVKGTKLWEAYGRDEVYERHRHRYDLNPEYIDKLEAVGLKVSAWDENMVIPEGIELENQLFIGVQYHPEYKSRPLEPSPIYYYYLEKLLR
ncbi:CTP synthetase [Ignicoccus islandicus DSM 13165]|uniref:CTP synthase n=1 Tax=Ignicoccus islandicus DSM 13165 TaxID=940295 RepID=A0A0U3G0F3_9CREN|nr:CTP synthase [Ignicoccus islandicus]ALU11804.1 CTP synthetase [Ignicoccus islandicus DSM 13165]